VYTLHHRKQEEKHWGWGEYSKTQRDGYLKKNSLSAMPNSPPPQLPSNKGANTQMFGMGMVTIFM